VRTLNRCVLCDALIAQSCIDGGVLLFT